MLSGLTNICDYQFQKITFTLTAVTENKYIACGFIFGTAMKIRENIRPEFIPTDIKSLRIGLAGKVKRI